MTEQQHRFLISNCEDIFYSGLDDIRLIAMSVVMTAGQHKISLNAYEVYDIIHDARQNFNQGLRTPAGVFDPADAPREYRPASD